MEKKKTAQTLDGGGAYLEWGGDIQVCYLWQVILPDADGHAHLPIRTGLVRYHTMGCTHASADRRAGIP